MVMEAPPSPQSVGREFVRQYYTLLNKAPTHLHRFYNNNSSFVHGGLDHNRDTSPIIGQKQIHQKIQQLNFRDCHAKITQVDSQATLSNGVVVQVTGELSNAGQPMRRFTQTFVLAAQSPKKYYVHNDIFRYQDEIISDEECEQEARSEPEDDLNQERQVIGDVQQQMSQPMGFYNQATPPLPNVQHHPAQQQPPPPPHILATQPVPTVNGSVHPDEMNMMQGQVAQHVTPPQQLHGVGAPMTGMQPGMVPVQAPPAPTATAAAGVAAATASVPVEAIQQTLEETGAEDERNENNFDETQEPESTEPQEPQQEPVLMNEPKTYATLLKAGGHVGYASAAQGGQVSSQPPKSISPPAQNHYDNRDNNQQSGNNQQMNQRNSANRGPRNNQAPRMPRQDSRNTGKSSYNDDGNTYEDRRRSQGNTFGDRDRDSNQLFLGNLPHSATEEDLRDIFLEFGQIVELRIHSKPVNKGAPPGTKVPPNYGFITYESQQAVVACLAAKPIYFPRNDSTGTQLNVEEKKMKDRPSYGGNRMDNGPRPRDGGPRRSQGGGPGGQVRGGGGGGGGGPNNRQGGGNFNRGPPPNRTANSSYSNRR